MAEEKQGLERMGVVWQKADGTITGVINAKVKKNTPFRLFPIDEQYRRNANSPHFTMKTDASNILEISDYDQKKQEKTEGKAETSASSTTEDNLPF